VELHARRTAELLLADQGTDDHQRIEQLYLQALGRHPSEAELVLTTQYVSVDDQAQRLERWTDLCQSVFGCLDFRYLD
jgi:hypothetical protein